MRNKAYIINVLIYLIFLTGVLLSGIVFVAEVLFSCVYNNKKKPAI